MGLAWAWRRWRRWCGRFPFGYATGTGGRVRRGGSVRHERRREFFFFIVFVSPLFSFHFFPSFLVFLHFRFSLVPFVPFARFSFFHFFFLFTIFLLDLHGLMGSWLGCRLGYGGQVILIKGTQVLFSFFFGKILLTNFFFLESGGPGSP